MVLLKKQKVTTVCAENRGYFENSISNLLVDGWRISSTNCSCMINSEGEINVYFVAVLIKEVG